MKLTETKMKRFTPHPETDGVIKAVIVDITEPRTVMTQWGEKEKFRLVFETEAYDDDNERQWCVWSRPYSTSIDSKSNFRRDLRKIMGRDLTQEELKEFDTECLIGMGVKIIIQHEHSPDGERIYDVISYIASDTKNPLKPSGAFTRQRDRDQDGDSKPAAKPAKTQAKENSWEDCVVHVGKHKGKKLGTLDEGDVQILIDKWLPKATAGGKADDKPLIAALTEVQSMLAPEDDY